MTRSDKETERYATTRTTSVEPLCASVAVGGSFVLELPQNGRITFGRSDEADVQLVVPSVSRMHLELVMSAGEVTISDLGSRNAVLLNGEPVTGARDATRGDEISFGAVRMALLSRAVVPSGVRTMLGRSSFVDRLDEEFRNEADLRVMAFRLTACWYEVDAVFSFLASLPAQARIGLVDACTLAIAIPAHGDLPNVAALRAAGLDVAVGVESTAAASNGRGLLDAALRALTVTAESNAEGTSDTGPVVKSPKMVALYDEAARIARTPMAILLIGETGAGKEVVARYIHEASGRPGRLVSVNTAALPETLIESELFGHEKGAFSGAHQAKQGLIEAAERGTLFLDEIGDIPLPLQAKLLRVLEERSIRRVGATAEKKVDVRVVAATHKDLERAVTAGTFRQDLLFRLNGCLLRIPPLRERPEDLETLVQRFVAQAAARHSPPRPPPAVAPAMLELLRAHAWPGNVRELRNVVDRAVALLESEHELRPAHLPDHIRAGQALGGVARSETVLPPPEAAGVRDALKEYERARILDALDRAEGNVARAAQLLGLPRRTLAYKLTRLGISTR